jgi:flagellar basal-body rod protein FlgF
MDDMLYIAMSGANQAMLAQGVNANNLANASTTGFKQDLLAFQALPLDDQQVSGRVYTSVEQNGVDMSPGPMTTTGADLDIAVNGEGWIAVQASDGSEAYTRAGSLHLTSTGNLINASGMPVLGNGGPIAIPPAEKIEVGVDGTISIRPEGQTPAALVVVDRIKLVNPDPQQLVKGDDGLMRQSDGEIAAPDASVSLVSGALEMSNVNVVDAMVNMIALSRQYEAEVKLMKTAEENDQSSTQLMTIQ